jgi:hypothetical protein
MTVNHGVLGSSPSWGAISSLGLYRISILRERFPLSYGVMVARQVLVLLV